MKIAILLGVILLALWFAMLYMFLAEDDFVIAAVKATGVVSLSVVITLAISAGAVWAVAP